MLVITLLLSISVLVYMTYILTKNSWYNLMLCIIFGVNAAVRKLTFQFVTAARNFYETQKCVSYISVKLISNNLPSGFTKKNVYLFSLLFATVHKEETMLRSAIFSVSRFVIGTFLLDLTVNRNPGDVKEYLRTVLFHSSSFNAKRKSGLKNV